MNIDFDNAYKYILNIKKYISKKYIKIYDVFIKILEDEEVQKILKIRANKFILKQDFYIYMSEFEVFKNAKLKEKDIYEFFKFLKNENYIDSSSDYWTIKRPIVQINKFHHFLQNDKFWIIDKIDEFYKEIVTKYNNTKEEVYLFILLTIFQEEKWDKYAIENINMKDMFIINNKIYSIIKMISQNGKFIPFYILTTNNIDIVLSKEGKLFKQKYNILNDESNKLIKSFFNKNINKYHIRRALIFNKLMLEAPVIVSIKNNILKSIPVSLLELNYFYKDKIPKHLLQIEQNNLKILKDKNIDNLQDDFFDDEQEVSSFDYEAIIEPLFYYKINKNKYNLLKNTNLNIKQEYIDMVIMNFYKKLKSISDTTTEQIIAYTIYGLKRIKPSGRNIKHETFVGYVQLLKKHFFPILDTLEDFQTENLEMLILRLNKQSKSSNSIKKIVGLIKSLLKFNNIRINSIVKPEVLVRKSLVFKNEIDLILENIEKKYTYISKNCGVKQNTYYKYYKNQDKAYILLLFYTGMRKSELLTRKHADIINERYDIYSGKLVDNGYCINVNINKLKKEKILSGFKSLNARRKINFYIDNQEHAKIINKFLKNSYRYGKKYLFKYRNFDIKQNKQNIDIKTVQTSILTYDKISYLNKVIYDVTQRYCTLHSLRHSYFTYKFFSILKEDNLSNEALLNLAIEMGHQVPQISIENYLHFNILEGKT